MANTPAAKAVPGIPLAALDAITDNNTRDVLRAVVDGLNVRNGHVGKGDERFITAKELTEVKQIAVGGGGGGSADGSRRTTLSPSQISRIITDLQAEVSESPLFKELGERIDLIDAPGGLFDRTQAVEVAVQHEADQRITNETALSHSIEAVGARVGDAEAATEDEITLRVNSDNALASAINFLWGVVGNNTGIVQQGSTIVVNSAGVVATRWNQTQAAIKDANGNYISSAAIKQTADTAVSKAGDIEAKYTVKFDINGYAAGFGLIGTANNSTPDFQFIVRADRFAIGSPSGPGITPQVPFIVQTTPKTLSDGTILPPGVYMDAAFVKELVGAYIEAGFFKAANIYTGSTLVDFDSKLPISSVAAGSWQGGGSNMEASQVRTDPSLRFYGPSWHSISDVYHRVRATHDSSHLLIFTVNISGSVDHYLSIWYRFNGTGPWIWLAKTVEPKADYGTASVNRVVTLAMSTSSYVEFGLSITNESMQVMNPGDSDNYYIRDWSMNVTCVNF